jgi:hypothetical protein
MPPPRTRSWDGVHMACKRRGPQGLCRAAWGHAHTCGVRVTCTGSGVHVRGQGTWCSTGLWADTSLVYALPSCSPSSSSVGVVCLPCSPCFAYLSRLRRPAHPSVPARVACHTTPSPLPACRGRAASPRPLRRVGGRGATCQVHGRLVCVTLLGCTASIHMAPLHAHGSRAKGGGHSLDPACVPMTHTLS